MTWSNVIILKVISLVKIRYNLKLEPVRFADRLHAGYEKRKNSTITSYLLLTKVEKFVEGTALGVNINNLVWVIFIYMPIKYPR